MSPDPGPLALAAQRKSHDAIARARSALRAMHDAGAPITFQASHGTPASHDNGSTRTPSCAPRSTSSAATRRPAARPRRAGASDASQRQCNATLTAENKRLRAENTGLKDELAALLGQRRAAPRSAR